MIKKISSILLVLLLTGCSILGLSTKETSVAPTVPPEFFKRYKKIAVQDFVFAEGLENLLSPADCSFLRNIVESKLLPITNLEIISRKNQALLVEEMGYKSGLTVPAPTEAGKETEAVQPKAPNIQQKMGADAFVYGVIYEYRGYPSSEKISMTVAIKIISVDDGRIWLSKIINITDKTKFTLFDQLGEIVAQSLQIPAPVPQQTVKPTSYE